jgi:hypothetical protein
LAAALLTSGSTLAATLAALLTSTGSTLAASLAAARPTLSARTTLLAAARLITTGTTLAAFTVCHGATPE